MNSKGFTLIELSAIIVIFATIFLIAFPNIMNTNKVNKDKEYKNMVNNLCLAGKSYIYSKIDEYPELSTIGSEINISIDSLVVNEYIESDLINPKTNKKLDNDSLKYKVLSDYSLDCKYIESGY